MDVIIPSPLLLTPHTFSVILSQLTPTVAASVEASDGLCLSVDWSASDTSIIAVSTSTGEVALVCLADGLLRNLRSWKAHRYEAWVTALCRNDQHVFSGRNSFYTNTLFSLFSSLIPSLLHLHTQLSTHSLTHSLPHTHTHLLTRILLRRGRL